MIIRDKIYINTEELGYNINSLCELFTYKNPEIFQKKKLKLSTKDIPTYLYHYRLDNVHKVLQIPRGGIYKVIEFYDTHRIPLDIQDKRVVHDMLNISLCDTVLEDTQRTIIQTLIQNDGGLIEMSPGGGKCLGYNTKVLMYNGSIKKVQDIVQDDMLMGDDLTPRKVIKASRGKGELYRITNEDTGFSFVCNKDHILTIGLSNSTIDVPLDTYMQSYSYYKHFKYINLQESSLNSRQNIQYTYSNFSVRKEKDTGDYFGFVINGNHRFLLDDLTVTHNTVAMLGLISQIKQPTLIIVHEHRLASQWSTEIKKRLKGSYTLGEYNGDQKKDGSVIVGIINTLYNVYTETPNFFEKFGMVIIDEVQHLPAKMFLAVVNNIPAKYRIGISGTVKRKDQKELLTYDVIGKLLIQIKAHKLKKRILPFTYKVINTNIEKSIPTAYRWTGSRKENVVDFVKLYNMLATDDKRNDLIIKHIIEYINMNHFPLVLSSRVKHSKLLYKALTEKGYKVVLLIGETRKRIKWDDVKKDDSIDCIIAMDKIASEGLDLPRLSVIFLTYPTSNLHKVEQQIGRIRRTYDNKLLPVVVDFCDNLMYLIEGTTKKYLLKYIATRRYRYYDELIKRYYKSD